jgi:hypothetical protein
VIFVGGARRSVPFACLYHSLYMYVNPSILSMYPIHIYSLINSYLGLHRKAVVNCG